MFPSSPTNMALLLHLLTLLSSTTILARASPENNPKSVIYDARSIIVNGKRELLYSGSIHYTRSTPDMWPTLIKNAKEGGLNMIDTYVFWNAHEPVRGQFDFSGQNDLIGFIKLIQEHGLYCILRLGPFIQAEWNHGGLPYWLREIPDMLFRTNNEPWKIEMEKWVRKVTDMVKAENLFGSQGGPIIIAQIENEYNSIQLTYRANGMSYIQWAANMALSLDIGIPWVMCKQTDAPDPVINACNGRHCGDTFVGPNKPHKPALWTENWTAQFRVFGDPPSVRSSEDTAFAVARWFSKNGSLTNYYMYHGGTNFGRTSAAFKTTRYYDEAPLDEYGLPREPKRSHLRDLHKALDFCRKPLLEGVPNEKRVSNAVLTRWYEIPGTNKCAAFLANNSSRFSSFVTFRNTKYFLPAKSISILPDCKTVVYNTQLIAAPHNSRGQDKSEQATKFNWEKYSEPVPDLSTMRTELSKVPLDLFGLHRDTTDYVWYSTSIMLGPRDLPVRVDIVPVLTIHSQGHALLAYVNGAFVGAGHGSHIEETFVFQRPISLIPGINNLTILGMTVGMPDSGAYMEHRFAGPRRVSIMGLNTGTLDLTFNGWGHQVGLEGEKMQLFTPEGAGKAQWVKKEDGKGSQMTWYRTNFESPAGTKPVGLRVPDLSKGMIWINGKSIGRYWQSYLSPLALPTQMTYHVPRAYLKEGSNLMVVLDEEGGDPATIEVLVINRDRVCSYVSEDHPPRVDNWEVKDDELRPLVEKPRPTASLKCPESLEILSVEFADWGDPFGSCGNFRVDPNCTSIDFTKGIVEKLCLGKNGCDIPIDRELLNKGHDTCPDFHKSLAVDVMCGVKKK